MGLKKALLMQSVILGTALALPAYAAMQVPTVADCVERTGKTEDDCKEMILRFGRDSRPPEGAPQEGMPEGQNKGGKQQSGDDADRIETASERTARMRADRERRYVRMQERISKIITYLDEQGAETAAVKGYLETFKAKVTDILGAYDVYLAALKTYEGDGSVANKAAVGDAKETLRVRIIDTGEYYRSMIMPALRSLIDALPE